MKPKHWKRHGGIIAGVGLLGIAAYLGQLGGEGTPIPVQSEHVPVGADRRLESLPVADSPPGYDCPDNFPEAMTGPGGGEIEWVLCDYRCTPCGEVFAIYAPVGVPCDATTQGIAILHGTDLLHMRWSHFDLNQDGVVDLLDYALLQAAPE